MRTLALGFGLGLGIMASEVADRILRPALGRPLSTWLQPGGFFAAVVLVTGVPIMFLLDRAQVVATADHGYWEDVMLSYASATVWNLIVQLERSWPDPTGVRRLRLVGSLLNWVYLLGIGVAVVYGALALGAPRREEALLCLAAAVGAVFALAWRLFTPPNNVP